MSRSENMMVGIGKLLTHRNRHYLLIPATILNLLPPLVASMGHPQELEQLVLFVAVSTAMIALYILWLSKHNTTWARLVTFGAGALLTGWYMLIFLPVLPNVYFGMVILVQLIFLLLGPRYGLAMLGIIVLSVVAYDILYPPPEIASSIFSVAVQATIGLLSWIFVSAANEMRHDAEHAASQANSAMDEAQRLAGEVTKLNKMLLNAQDVERQRLARDIHDGPLQAMGVELLALDRAKRRLEASDHQRAGMELEYLRELIRDTVTDLRDMVNALRNSLLDSGIQPALRSLAHKTQDAGVNMEVIVHLDEEPRLEGALANCIYQLAVEGLNNITKHAHASNVVLSLEATREEVMLCISDDGRGFDYEAAMSQALDRGRIGLRSMKERVEEFGGSMAVSTTPGPGTTLRFTFPRPSQPAPLA